MTQGKMIDNNLNSGALFSDDRVYRYALWRTWSPSQPSVMFIGLNPSTADESQDDPTIPAVEIHLKHQIVIIAKRTLGTRRG